MPGSPNVDGNDLLKFHMVKKAEIKPNTELSKIVDAEIKEYFEKFDNNPQNGTLDQIELLEYIKERAKIPSADPGQGKREEITSENGEKLVKCLATGDSSLQTRSYKENRFFPLTKAGGIACR